MRSRHTPRVGFNAANARKAKKLMDSLFYGFVICDTCGEKFSPVAYETLDICPGCRVQAIARERGVKAEVVREGWQLISDSELGSRFIVSGGEVMELGKQTGSDEEIPF